MPELKRLQMDVDNRERSVLKKCLDCALKMKKSVQKNVFDYSNKILYNTILCLPVECK